MSFVLANLAFAEGDRDPLSSSYLLHLYYDSGKLVPDRDYQFKYEVIPEKFVPETVKSSYPYKGEVVNLQDKVVSTFQFDSWVGLPKFVKGKVSVKAPYAPDGKKVNFYDGQGNQLLSIFVSESSFCNDDGVCNSDTGEDYKTCPADCKPLATAVPTPSVEPSTGGGENGVLKGLIYLIIGLAVIGGLWYWLKKRNQLSVPMPPSPPDINV